MKKDEGPEYEIKYLGCYKDNSSRDMKHGPKKYGYKGVDGPKKCHDACKQYKYFALQNNGWCSCDNTYGTPASTYKKLSDAKCGSTQPRSGKGWTNAVYTKQLKSVTSKHSKPALISQGKPTSMSSRSPYAGQHMGLSSKAVDGNTNQNWGGKSCTHTKSMSNPWWKVDLQANYKVSNVKVWNRSDCCGSRLDPFQVFVGSHKCGGNHSIKQGQSKDVSCGNKEGSSVKIQVRKGTKKAPLTICEVKVYGSRA